MTTTLKNHPPMIRGLLQAQAYPHPCPHIELVETHISWVILTGPYAYKIKKPVNMGFLDFSSLSKRHFYCQEELRLNSRGAPDTYLAVVPITGTPSNPKMEGSGEPFEYAVKMNQFDQSDMLDRQLQVGRLSGGKIDRLGDQIAALHRSIPQAGESDEHGTLESIRRWALENFEQLDQLIKNEERRARIADFEQWTKEQLEHLSKPMRERKLDGHIKECHGDLHLGNITEIEDKIVLFDGIEFNPEIRWIDALNEMAFLFTDLEHREHPDMAWRILNRYLESTGDYRGLHLFRFYRLYRIMVRAKVDSLRFGQLQKGSAERKQLETDIDRYLAQADSTLEPKRSYLILMRGLSGSGKTYISQNLLEAMGAIRIRSDVERKRLYHLAAHDSSDSSVGAGLYTSEANRKTFNELESLAREVLKAGYPVIVDATFLDPSRIAPFAALAQEFGSDFQVLDVRVPEAVLRERLAIRALDQDEASEADEQVLNWQLPGYELLEESFCLPVDGVSPPDGSELLRMLQRKGTRSDRG